MCTQNSDWFEHIANQRRNITISFQLQCTFFHISCCKQLKRYYFFGYDHTWYKCSRQFLQMEGVGNNFVFLTSVRNKIVSLGSVNKCSLLLYMKLIIILFFLQGSRFQEGRLATGYVMCHFLICSCGSTHSNGKQE